MSLPERLGRSHHISFQTKRSWGIHFLLILDLPRCTYLIFVCQLQAKQSPGPFCTQCGHYPSRPARTNATSFQGGALFIGNVKPVAGSWPVVWHCWIHCREAHAKRQGEKRKWRAAVIFVSCRYEMLFWEIKDGRMWREGGDGKKKPLGSWSETRTLPEKKGEVPRRVWVR